MRTTSLLFVALVALAACAGGASAQKHHGGGGGKHQAGPWCIHTTTFTTRLHSSPVLSYFTNTIPVRTTSSYKGSTRICLC